MQKNNILRIVDKKTSLFIRDDFTFNTDKEIGLDVPPAQGLYKPKWNFDTEEWVEGATQEEIDELTKPQPQESTVEERLEETERIAQMTSLAFSEYVFGAMKGDY